MTMPRLLVTAVMLALAIPAAADGPGDFNAAPFGTPSVLTSDSGSPTYCPAIADGKAETAVDIPSGGAAQVEWREPRDVYAVRLVFDGAAPRPEDVKIEYWYRLWPDNGEGGWMKLDDPFNGSFVTAAVRANASKPGEITFRLEPLDNTENPHVKKTGFDWRTAYKFRAVFQAAVRLAEIECITDSRWKSASVVIDVGSRKWDMRVEARNASVREVSTRNPSQAHVFLRYADNPNRLSPDRGSVIMRRDGKGQDFSFFVDDVVREGSIYVRDIDALISHGERADLFTRDNRPAGMWKTTVTDRVAAMPEQTFERAFKEIPRMWIDQAHLGLPVLRQEMSIDASSQIYAYSKSLRGMGEDVARSSQFPEEWSQRRFTMVTRQLSFGPPGPKRIKRWLEEGYLPVIHSTWNDEGIDYHQAVFVTALDPKVTRESLALPKPPPTPAGKDKRAADFGVGLRGDEPIAILSRLEIANPAETDQDVSIWFKPSPMAPMSIAPDGLLVLDRPTKPAAGKDLVPVGGQINIRGRGELAYLKNYIPDGGDPKSGRDLMRYTLKLGPGEKHIIYIKVPYIEQLAPEQVELMRALDWEKSHSQIVDLWKKRLAHAIDDYHVPEPGLINLYRANLWHVLIGTDRDPPTGLYQHGAGTYDYPMYANETMMVARMLEMRGEHEEARRLIEPYIVSQGRRSLPGNFKSKEGLLYAATPEDYDQYTAQGYNMHHGFILWAAAEHYLWTRDATYLRAIAPNLIAACDWITRERQATKVLNPDGARPIEYGLAPAGDLEDVEEYLYFYATNAYYYLGMKTTADALAAIRHPDAARIVADTKAYADDIMASVRESTATSPVVKLMDGTYVPYVPPRAYAVTDQKEGWIREALYCALHLESCGLIEADDQLTTWILHDLEDRIYMSDVSGKPPEASKMELEDYFFSLSGYNPQPNLLDNPITYLRRGQIPSFVRAFWNIYSASLHPDTVCFAECCPPFAAGGACVYKTPDESKFIQTMRHMLVMEMGNDLYLGRGVPRLWMEDGKVVEFRNAPTFFGPVSLKITSAVSKNKITAELVLPDRNPAEAAHISFRHPAGAKMKSVTVNGRQWRDFDAESDQVTLPGDTGKVTVVATY